MLSNQHLSGAKRFIVMHDYFCQGKIFIYFATSAPKMYSTVQWDIDIKVKINLGFCLSYILVMRVSGGHLIPLCLCTSLTWTS